MTTKTGRGRHVYVRPTADKVKTRAPLVGEYPHVDSRGDGGYVVAPPSMHYSGTRYEFDPTMPLEVADAPGWLIDLINGAKQTSNRPTTAAANDPIATGSRNCSFASLAGSMRLRGMTQDAIEAALLVTNQQQCTPPLPDDEVRTSRAASRAMHPACRMT